MKGGRAIDCLFRSLERNVFQKVTPLPIFSGLSSRNYFSYRILRTYWYGNLLLQKSSTKIDYLTTKQDLLSKLKLPNIYAEPILNLLGDYL